MKIPAKKGDKCISDSREELSLYPEDTVGGPGPGYRSPSDHQRNLPSADRETFYKAIILRHRVRAGGLVDPTTTTITVFTCLGQGALLVDLEKSHTILVRVTSSATLNQPLCTTNAASVQACSKMQSSRCLYAVCGRVLGCPTQCPICACAS